MNTRERIHAVLHYAAYDRLPLVHFGFWSQTLEKWAREGHLDMALAEAWSDGNPACAEISRLLGFDSNWATIFSPQSCLYPGFEEKRLETLPSGSEHWRNVDGVTIVKHPGVVSIPGEVEHLLEDRESWGSHYKDRLRWSEDRVLKSDVRVGERLLRFDEGGLEFLRSDDRDEPMGISCGSMIGRLRDIVGVENLAYLPVDDEALFDEMLETFNAVSYRAVEFTLEQGARFDFGHLWEDICFKNGPLVNPRMFSAKIGPYYKRVAELLHRHGIDLISLDSDGCIDALLPIWFENGINVMFPIEVGTWNASIAPWREQYGRELRGVGGMNKTVFARDRKAVDVEIERLKPLVDLGGYIPCPDHRIAPDAEWDLVQYYTARMRQAFG